MKPDNASFNSAIHACASAGQWDEALTIINKLPDHDLQPDVWTYNVVLFACSKLGEANLALTLWEDMARLGVQPDVFSYCAVIMASKKSGRSQRALELLNEMDTKIPPRALQALVPQLRRQLKALRHQEARNYRAGLATAEHRTK